MQADVAIERIGEVGAVRRVGCLIRQELALGRERKAFEIVPAADLSQARTPERVRPQGCADAGLQPLELQGADLVETTW